jgi:hypothetical protein
MDKPNMFFSFCLKAANFIVKPSFIILSRSLVYLCFAGIDNFLVLLIIVEFFSLSICNFHFVIILKSKNIIRRALFSTKEFFVFELVCNLDFNYYFCDLSSHFFFVINSLVFYNFSSFIYLG